MQGLLLRELQRPETASRAPHLQRLQEFLLRELQRAGGLQMQTLALEHIDELQLLLERDDELRTLPLQPPVVGHHAVVLGADNVLALMLLPGCGDRRAEGHTPELGWRQRDIV